eukprot:scaffold258730_cov30-Prasinocladus_malaysianus.AAC.1
MPTFGIWQSVGGVDRACHLQLSKVLLCAHIQAGSLVVQTGDVHLQYASFPFLHLTQRLTSWPPSQPGIEQGLKRII